MIPVITPSSPDWFQLSTPSAFGLTCGYSLSIFTWEVAPRVLLKLHAMYNPPLHLTPFFYSQLISTAFLVYGGGPSSYTLLLQTAVFVAHSSISPALNSWISGIPWKYAEPFAKCDHIRIVRFPLFSGCIKLSKVRFFLSSYAQVRNFAAFLT